MLRLPKYALPQIYRSSQPLTHSDLFDVIYPMGIRTIINLQEGFTEALKGPSVEAVHWEKTFGNQLHRFPLSNIFPPCLDELKRIMECIRDSKDRGSVLIHCKKGQDRTGFVIAWLQVAMCGDDPETAWRDCGAAGMAWHYRVFWRNAFFKACQDHKNIK